MWSVGTPEDREAVLPFTREGIVLTSERAGSAQVSILIYKYDLISQDRVHFLIVYSLFSRRYIFLILKALTLPCY